MNPLCQNTVPLLNNVPIWVLPHFNSVLSFLELTPLLCNLITFFFCSIVSTFILGDKLSFLAHGDELLLCRGLLQVLEGVAGIGGCLESATGAGEGLEGVYGICGCMAAATGTWEGLEDVPDIGGCLGAVTGPGEGL